MSAPSEPRFRRIALVVLDSVGVGEAPDAARFGDAGSDTVGHILEAVGLDVPNLAALGLGRLGPRLARLGEPTMGAFGTMVERSEGKDTMTGHFEIAGVVVPTAYPTFTDTGFPDAVIDAFCRVAEVEGVLGNEAASGTEIIDRLGEEHLATGKPIVYTSADSVFQIAAHERLFPRERQHEICRLAREQVLVGEHAVARVIARPFVGERAGAFERTTGRKDFALTPPAPTVLDRLADAGHAVVSVGKIADIFSMRGIARAMHGKGNPACIDDALAALSVPAGAADDWSLLFVNLVDFDTQYGHRNDPTGYRDCLQAFDARLPALLDALRDDDLLVLTADHGNDPCFPGTDHTREVVPLLAYRRGLAPTDLGQRQSFADVAATIADNFGVAQPPESESFLGQLA